MLIAGVVLSASAIALLARRLQETGHLELAVAVGVAVDANRHELPLGHGEEDTIRRALHDCPAQLKPLRDALRRSAQAQHALDA